MKVGSVAGTWSHTIHRELARVVPDAIPVGHGLGKNSSLEPRSKICGSNQETPTNRSHRAKSAQARNISCHTEEKKAFNIVEFAFQYTTFTRGMAIINQPPS